MLNKKNTQRAEQLAQLLAPEYKKAEEFANKWQELESRLYKDRNRAIFAHNMAESNRLFKALQPLETAENCARLNFVNQLYFICELIAQNIRPYWWELCQRKGADTFAQILTDNTRNEGARYTPASISTHIYISCYEQPTETAPNGSAGFQINTAPAGGCGVSVSWRGDFAHLPQEWQPTKPQEMTPEQYAEKVAKIEALKDKAKALQSQAERIAEELGKYKGERVALFGIIERE